MQVWKFLTIPSSIFTCNFNDVIEYHQKLLTKNWVITIEIINGAGYLKSFSFYIQNAKIVREN